jgi:hypothetical protein
MLMMGSAELIELTESGSPDFPPVPRWGVTFAEVAS